MSLILIVATCVAESAALDESLSREQLMAGLRAGNGAPALDLLNEAGCESGHQNPYRFSITVSPYDTPVGVVPSADIPPPGFVAGDDQHQSSSSSSSESPAESEESLPPTAPVGD